MKLFGFNITRASALSGGVSSRPVNAQGPWSAYFDAYMARSVSPALFEILRESIPVLDAAIDRLVTLDGVPEIEGDNQALVDEIREWAEEVQCGDVEIGLAAVVRNWRNEIHEQGFGMVEWVYASDGRDIVRINIADSKAIHFGRKDDGSLAAFYSPYKRPRFIRRDATTDRVREVLNGRAGANLSANVLLDEGMQQLDMLNKRVMSYRSENGGDPYGVSLMRSMEFVSKTLLTIENGLLNTWERYGDPSFHVHYTASNRVNATDLETRRKGIATSFADAINGKRAGQSADFVTAVDKDSDVQISVIGHDGQAMEVEMPARHVLEQIVAKTGLPPWMLGLIWGTSERLAKYQLELLKQESDTRTVMERPHVEAVIAAMLRARGRSWKQGDWRVEYDKPNLADEVAKAQANFMNAQADAVRANAGLADGQPITITTGGDGEGDNAPQNRVTIQPVSLSASHKAPRPCHHNSPRAVLEQRPIPNPAMEQVEQAAVDGIRALWNATADHVEAILGLPSAVPTAGTTANGFSFTEADKSAITSSLAEFTADALRNDGTDIGVMELATIQSWAQGVIDAYTANGLTKPVGDPINYEAVAAIRGEMDTTFTTNLSEQFSPKLWRILETGVQEGVNPVEVGRRLRNQFDGFAWKMEQIARSETAIAQSRAKVSEWQAQIDDGVTPDLFEWIPAPDACPICMALVAGNPYTLKTLPRPVEDTHPNDRCTTIPHA